MSTNQLDLNKKEDNSSSEEEKYSNLDDDEVEELAHNEMISEMSNEEKLAYLAQQQQTQGEVIIKVGPVYTIRGESNSSFYQEDVISSDDEDEGDETESEEEVEQSVQDITLLNMSNEERTTYLAAQQAQLNALFNRLGLD